MFGWVVPAYALAKSNEDRKVLRIVCRWDFNPTLAAELIEDLKEALDYLETHHIYSQEQLEEIGAKVAAHEEKKKAAPRWVKRHGFVPLNERGKC